MLFTESTMLTKAVLDPSNGYATFLHGKVVDMFYFPIINGVYPDWAIIPSGLRGDQFIFFRPVFNLADSAITVGVIILLLFQKRYFQHEPETVLTAEAEMAVNHPESEPQLLSTEENNIQ